MRVCLLGDRGNMYSGGQGVYLHYLSKELHRLGHDVCVIVGPPYPNIVEGVSVERIPDPNFFEKGLCRENVFQAFSLVNFYELAATKLWMFPELFAFGFKAYDKARRLQRQSHFDIIHDNQTLSYGTLLLKALGIPVVATVHHPLPIDRKAEIMQAEDFKGKLGGVMFYPFFMQHLVARRMDRVITVSQSSAEEARNAFGVSPDRLRVVYNGIDTALFRRREGVKKEKGRLIVVGNTRDRKKGILYLMRALQLLKGEVDVKLTVVDAIDPDDAFACELVGRYGIEDMVTFTGHIDNEELIRRYSASEIAVTPSIYEGFGLPPAEAMSCEVPVVATTAGALPEVIGDGETGILVPPADEVALAAAIKRLLGDEELRLRMGKSGRERVKRLFNWESTAKRVVEVYQEVI